MALPLDQFIPEPDVRERFDTIIKAPADLVMEVAKGFDMQSVWLIRTIFRLREMIMGASGTPRKPQGIVAETRSLGWGTLSKSQLSSFAEHDASRGSAACNLPPSRRTNLRSTMNRDR